jgi:primosomal protein N' (replication factor Y)
LVGVVLEVGNDEPAETLRSVLLAPDPFPLVPPSLLELAQWISRYYAAPIGLSLKTMLPAALWGSSRLVATIRDASAAPGGTSKLVLEALERAGGRAPAGQLSRRLKRPVWDTLQRLSAAGAVTLETEAPDLGPTARVERVLVLTEFLPTLIERQETFGRAKRQREAYEAADGLGGEIPIRLLTKQLGFSASVVEGLVSRGIAKVEERERPRDPFDDLQGVEPPNPTDAQKLAIAAVRELPQGDALTLFGVTGSGKTLVYLDAFRDEVKEGKSVIVLVPDRCMAGTRCRRQARCRGRALSRVRASAQPRRRHR